ncbi:autotransporter domain-containing protein [Microvirga sp. TS319]|uniref:autotransporter outer membrane beta-barrel domain-containing protein n=1 Tax=Microvirga sp. TS319 TaxID=3241165 RepID=UPI00351A1988
MTTALVGIVILATSPMPARADGGRGGAGDSAGKVSGGSGGSGSTGANGGIGADWQAGADGGGGGGGGAAGGGKGGQPGTREGLPRNPSAGGAGGTAGSRHGADGASSSDAYTGGGGGGGGAHAADVTAGPLPAGHLWGGRGGNGGDSMGAGGGGGGAGGSGAVVRSTAEVIVGRDYVGGNGGRGGSGVSGGAGGDGGAGLYLQGASNTVMVTRSGTVAGGNGGTGGGAFIRRAGDGGNGGAGIAASQTVITNQGTVLGGDAGAKGPAPIPGIDGIAGAGIAGADLSITNSGEISGGRNVGMTYGTAINFTGGTNTLTLMDGSVINGGVNLATGSLTVTNASAQTLQGGISGSGSLTKNGPGVLTLAGTSSFSGNTMIDEGRLAVDGSLAQSIVTVSGGSLSGTGTVGGIAVQSGGMVAPGNSIGTLNVSGNVSFAPGSIFQVEINGSEQSDRIAATGTATLNGGTVRILPDQGRYSLSPYTILTAKQGVTGQFRDTKVEHQFAFLNPVLDYGPDAVTLTLLERKSEPNENDKGGGGLIFNSVATTINQYRVADAVERLGFGNDLFETVLGASEEGARQAFDALSGEVHASAVAVSYGDDQLVQDAVLHRLRHPMGSLPTLGQGGYAVAYAADRPGGSSQAIAMAPAFDPRRFALWGVGFGSWGKVHSNGNAAGLDTSTGGFVLGAETRMDETYRIGVAGGFISTSFDIDGRLSSGTNETVFGSLYGAAKWDAVNVRLGMLYAHHDVDVNRTIAFPGFGDRASASYDGSTLMAFGEVGYEFGLGKVKLEPFLGASVMRLHMDGFREDGGPAVLVGYGRSYELGTTTLGIRAETQLGTDLPLTLRGLVGWRHAFGDVNPAALLAFSEGVSAFEVSGVPIDRNAFVAETGLDWQINKDMTLGVSYAGQVDQRAQEHALKGNFTWRFETR